MAGSALRMLARDWRGGELGVLVAALVLAVAVVAGISAFTGRLQSALEFESHRFLAADRVVRSSAPLPGAWLEEARSRGLRTARMLTFSSMVAADGDALTLASIKAVSGRYPLRGELTASVVPYGEAKAVDRGPAPGELWLDSRLFALLDISSGALLSVGEAEFRVTAAVRTEPDRGTAFLGVGPRVLMHVDDIPATGVVQPGSRVSYRQLYAGAPEAVAAFTAWLEPRLEPGQRLLRVEDGQPGIGAALARAESFLLLAGSLGVLLAAVAIALAARRFSERHNDYVAIMKSLGATTAAVGRLYGGSLMLLGVLATAAGCLLGGVLQAVAFDLFSARLPFEPGPAGWRPYLMGGTTALVCLLCFAWPPLWRLAGASPLRVLRRDLPRQLQRSLLDYALGLAAVFGLMWWYSSDLRLTLAVLAGLALTVILGALLAALLLRGGRLAGMRAGSIWRLALASLQRRGAGNALQVVMFAVAIMLLLLLTLVRTSLIDSWQTQLPAQAPDHFILNIAPEEVAAVEQTLRRAGLESEGLYPMIRGRVMAVNDQALPTEGEGPTQREANFTWSSRLPEGNELAAGEWWEEDSGAPLVSLEVEFAERLGVAVGDRLALRIGAQPLTVTVASLRSLDWQSMRPNFFMVFPPRLLAEFPATFMTSVHLGEQKPFLNSFIRTFPTASVIEMDVVVAQLRAIVSQVSAAIELVLALILLAGALVLIAGVQASVDNRTQESALLRALGARRGLIIGALAIEFAALGLFAGLLATLGAELSAWLLQTQVLEMAYAPTFWLWPLGVLGAAALIAALGVAGCRRVVTTAPLLILRD